jgi:type VI protein secretion system component Hcp
VLARLGGQGAHQVSGRDYAPVVFTQVLSSASVMIFKMLVENTAAEIEVHLTRAPKAGASQEQKPYSKYKFKGAKFGGIKHTAVESGGEAYMEEVSFKFNQVVISSDDDTTGEKPEAEDNVTIA